MMNRDLKLSLKEHASKLYDSLSNSLDKLDSNISDKSDDKTKLFSEAKDFSWSLRRELFS